MQNKIPEENLNVIDIESKVVLNKEVNQITYDVKSSAANRIKIQCSDTTTYECDHLICTVPLGVLKKYHLNMFEPLLPRKKIDSIESVAFGTVNKIYVEFAQPFWDKNWEGVSFLWQSKQLQEIQDIDPENVDWMKNIIGFYTVSFQPNILCGWISGNAARKMEHANEIDFENSVKRVLNIFVEPFKNAKVNKIIRYVTLFFICICLCL